MKSPGPVTCHRRKGPLCRRTGCRGGEGGLADPATSDDTVGCRLLWVCSCTLTDMARLSSVPDWVRPSLRAVASVEDYLLRLFGRTRSSEVLGGHAALAWLGGA